jgi:hypothetical protein
MLQRVGLALDAHSSLEANHTENCKSSDKPVAGLLADLNARGMLKDTLVVWGGEFGRTPFVQGSPNDEKAGRPQSVGFTMWMAGGGVMGGQVIGSTDEIGLRALEEPHHVHDIQASILYLLGLDHQRTTFLHNGRAERPTGTAGALIPKLWLKILLFAVAASSAVAQTLPEGPGKEVVEAVCSTCHAPTRAAAYHGSKMQWQSKVTEMLEEETDVSDSDATAIVNYLAKNFPPVKVNVNKAAARELQTSWRYRVSSLKPWFIIANRKATLRRSTT